MSVPPFRRAIERRIRVVGFLLAPVAAFVLISLATHSQDDYPNSNLGPDQVVNWGGAPGALVSYGLTLALGYGGYAAPILIALLARYWIRGGRFADLLTQCVWLLALTTTGIATASVIPMFPAYLRFEISGVLGFYLGRQMAAFLGVNASVAAGTLVFLSILGFTAYRTRRRAASSARSGRPAKSELAHRP